jgi:hypothetical protein
MNVIFKDTSKKQPRTQNPRLPEPEPPNPKSEPKSPGSDPGDINGLPPPPSAHIRHLPKFNEDHLLAVQRKELGDRAHLCDPVLRQHIGLPPLPDPYEEERRRAEAWQKVRHKYVK